MRHWKSISWLPVALFLVSSVLIAQGRGEKGKEGDSIVIIIDADMKYIKEGDKESKPVTVMVGQTVTWINKHSKVHDATSAKTKDGKDDGEPIFETDPIKPGKSASYKFDQKVFEAFGGKKGGEVTIDYICSIHPDMKGKLILKSK
jgi:plastocyanin